jgi:hypothetical protein
MLSHPTQGERHRTVLIESERSTSVTFAPPARSQKQASAEKSQSEPAEAPEQKEATSKAASRADRAGCNPRWYVDDSGVRRVKPECLRLPNP